MRFMLSFGLFHHLLLNYKELNLVCQGNLDHKIWCQVLMFVVGLECVYCGFKSRIFVEIDTLFSSEKKKRHVQRCVPMGVLFIEIRCK
jgi:hypothetical protein